MPEGKSPGGSPSGGQGTCPKCRSEQVRTIPVEWYPELKYLSCDRCRYMWTVERTNPDAHAMATPCAAQGSNPAIARVESVGRMSEPLMRIQRKRVRGWRMPLNTVYVGRGTKWGPPWVKADFWWATDPARASVEAYREYIVRRALRDPHLLDALRGKHLACWCPLDQPCHAEVLLELANPGNLNASDPGIRGDW